MQPQLAITTQFAALTSAIVASSYGAVPAWDLGHFKNASRSEVLVYLEDRADHYYAVFGVGPGGTNIMDLRPHTTAIVTLLPVGKAGHVVLTPEGKRIAKSKLFIPPRAKEDTRDRKLFYVIGNGKVTFVGSPSSNHSMQPTASPGTTSLSMTNNKLPSKPALLPRAVADLVSR